MGNRAREIIETGVVYDFACEGCGTRGEVTVPVEARQPFGCPEGCGATYVQWQAPSGYELMCVVCPVFESPDEEPIDEAQLEHAIRERREWLEMNYSDDSDDVTDEDALEDLLSDCGMDREGYCSKAGSEECDFECPFSG